MTPHPAHPGPILSLGLARVGRSTGVALRPLEFHIRRAARRRYGCDDSLFSSSGAVVFPNYHAVRRLAEAVNTRRDLAEPAVRAGDLNALGLIDEILHHVVTLYLEQIDRRALHEALAFAESRLGAAPLQAMLLRFVEEFPPAAVLSGARTAEQYLSETSGGFSHREITLEELLLMWLGNRNPAASPLRELFDEAELAAHPAYAPLLQALQEFFAARPPFGPQRQSLVAMLRSPAERVPHSLPGQLHYIREHWGLLLGNFFYRILSAFDLIKEEEHRHFVPGGGGAAVLTFPPLRGAGAGAEAAGMAAGERFSPDRAWMPQLVLLAKSTFVWLHQLERKYRRPVRTLADIPEEELALIAGRGFSGLWLIGLWERSKASSRIKRMCGNPEAAASAYSLHDYRIAAELGGPEALGVLRERARRHGLHLAADMVPNHMGIDSRWVVEHPEWFLSLPHPPYPAYSFNGPDLSTDESVDIRIEDHYYDRSDAAVVFRRIDKRSGHTSYIYHGNDGTRLPWNDTAQLNYLLPEVREAVIQTILQVAREFPVIRFDAAMTLTHLHYQRLWFPEPGSGGDIPSRSDFSLTRAEFNHRIPQEFFREVVDRVAAEAPDTLLLAEAFWLMESYFVRSLGMHRVYNSAFMNFLKNEENDKFRLSIKNTLEFNPEILKRFVNFLNNPDEETAIAQFGRDDKYFGVTLMMVTLPGLPMFGHGQVEGFREKYGMEYRRSYLDEEEDADLIARHEWEIFPLLRRRRLFAEVEHFWLFDFHTADGRVDENVFAYTNRCGDERALVVFHNRYHDTSGWLHLSAAKRQGGESGPHSRLVRSTLAEALGLTAAPMRFTVYREQRSGLEYVRPSRDFQEKGLHLHLGAYHYVVLVDFQEVTDESGEYQDLCRYLDGRGVPSIAAALRELRLRPLHRALRELLTVERLRSLTTAPPPAAVSEALQAAAALLDRLAAYEPPAVDRAEILRAIERELRVMLELPHHDRAWRRRGGPDMRRALHMLRRRLGRHEAARITLCCWIFTHRLGQLYERENYAARSRSLADELLLGGVLREVFAACGLGEEQGRHQLHLLLVLVRHQDFLGRRPDVAALTALLRDPEVQALLGVNLYEGVRWFDRDAFRELFAWFFLTALLEHPTPPHPAGADLLRLYHLADRAEYRLDRLLEMVHTTAAEGRG